MIAPEIFDSEPDSSELDGIKFFNLVVILSSLVLERSSHQPKSVNGLFLHLFGAESVVKEITLFIFLELAKASAVWVLNLIDDMIGLGEVDLVLVPDDLALGLSLERHLHDVP